MKFSLAILILGSVGCSLAQEAAATAVQQTAAAGAQKQYPVRDLPADVLRDFPGACFGSTTFRFYQIGESWPLAPFCGLATCLTDGHHLIERVRDCGLLPKPNPKCKVVNEADNKLAFPKCCPKFECEEGASLEYPTPEELRQFAEEAHRAQLAVSQQQQVRPLGNPQRRRFGTRRPISVPTTVAAKK